MNTTTHPKTKYIAETTINHDGQDYAIGDEIELTEAQAKPLLASRDVATRDMASNEAREAPKCRQKEADEKEAAAARAEYDKAVSESQDADAEAKAATAKADEAKRKSEAAKTRLGKLKGPHAPGPKTWEQDADNLGGEQLSAAGGTAAGSAAKAPAKGSKMTPSSPTAEATKSEE